jgi:hypothetical protein
MNINVETRWKIWACELGKFGFRLHPSLLHTPFNSSWCYIIIINIINEETWFKRWACLPNQPPKISDLGIFGEMGLIPPKSGHPRWPTSVFHTGKEARQGSASLTPGESRQGHDPPLCMCMVACSRPQLCHTHMYTYTHVHTHASTQIKKQMCVCIIKRLHSK